MNGRQFGPCLADYGTRFRLWAPAANRVDVVLEQPHAMKRGEDGWFTAEIAEADRALSPALAHWPSS